MKKKQEREFTETEILEFLSDCGSMDRDAQDGGWAFNMLVSHEKGNYDAMINPTDIRLAVRGEYDLRKAVIAALKIKKGF